MASSGNSRFDRQPEGTDDREVRVVEKSYSERRLRKCKGALAVSILDFKRDLGVFDPEMKSLYSDKEISTIMRLVFKKVVRKIICSLWRMPFPNGMGRLYMCEKQIDLSKFKREDPDTPSDREISQLLRECQLGMKRTRMKWNKKGIKRFPYKDIWTIRRSTGFFRSLKYQEVLERAKDPTRQNYRGHID